MWTDLLTDVFAAEAPAPQVVADSSPIIVALISALSGVVVAAIGAVVALARRGSDQTTTASPSSPAVPVDPEIRERVAVLEDWRVRIRGADDVHDRRLDYAEEVLEDVCRILGVPFDPRSRREPS